MKLTKCGLPEALQAGRDSFLIYKFFEYVSDIVTIYNNVLVDLPLRRVMVITKI